MKFYKRLRHYEIGERKLLSTCHEHSDENNADNDFRYFAIDDSTQCQILDYTGKRCTNTVQKFYLKEVYGQEINLTEIREFNNVFLKHLNVNNITIEQFENFHEFIFLMKTTIVVELFQSDVISLPKKFPMHYDYFLEKLAIYTDIGKIPKITIDENILSQHLNKDALNNIPTNLYYNFKDQVEHFSNDEKNFYKRYIILMHLLFAMTDLSERGNAYRQMFFKDIYQYSYSKTYIDVFSDLIFSIHHFKKTRVTGIIHFSLRKKFETFLLYKISSNVVQYYEKSIINNFLQNPLE